MRNLMFIWLCLFCVIPSQARTITVDDDGPADFNNIQAAIDDANDGDEIIVADGTYTGPGNTGIECSDRSMTIRSENGPEHTIIDCEDRYDGFRFRDLTRSEAFAVNLEGLTICNGYMGVWSWYFGLTMTDCIVNKNKQYGIKADYGDVTIRNCIVSDNSDIGIDICRVSGTIQNCTIKGNKGRFNSGIECDRSNSVVIANCVITDNVSVVYGGAIGCYESSPLITNCIISGNRIIGYRSSGVYGGAIYCNIESNPTIKNCTISDNTLIKAPFGTECYGGAIYSEYYSSAVITNCILWGNEALEGPQVYLAWGSQATVSHTDMEGGQADVYVEPSCTLNWGEGNVDADACFVEVGYYVDANDANIVAKPNDPNAVWVEGDYHLLEGSPCIDTGDPNYVGGPNETDLDGRPRALDGNEDGTAVVDMGAYEFAPAIEAVVKIRPKTLNLRSKGKWIMCVISLPEDYSVADIEPNSVFLEDEVPAEGVWLGDEFAVAKFSRRQVQEMLGELETPSEVELVVSGELSDGTIFEGTDTIRVIDKGRRINNPPGRAGTRVILKRR